MFHKGSVPTLLAKEQEATGVVGYKAFKDTLVGYLLDCGGNCATVLRLLCPEGYYRIPGSSPHRYHQPRPCKRTRLFTKANKLSWCSSFKRNLFATPYARD